MTTSLASRDNGRSIIIAGILLGIGLGGFIDGIVLHQVLQWHHMLTDYGYPPDNVDDLEINTLWDGLFHASTWVISTIGLFLVWRAAGRAAAPWSFRVLLGTLALGWGLFNLVEGVIDHHILGLHHVNETVSRDDWIYWDLGFLVFAALLILIGIALVRAGLRGLAQLGSG